MGQTGSRNVGKYQLTLRNIQEERRTTSTNIPSPLLSTRANKVLTYIFVNQLPQTAVKNTLNDFIFASCASGIKNETNEVFFCTIFMNDGGAPYVVLRNVTQHNAS
jgi:hypothetical protein